MPIDSTHPQYKEMSDVWMMCRDAYDGERAVKAKGVRYLPKLDGQSVNDYNSYKTRATFFGITERTISALVGMATYRPMVVRAPDDLRPYVQDAEGAQVSELLSTILRELLLTGRLGLLADAPTDGGQPFIVTYPAESIRNWAVGDDGLLDWVVLEEEEQVPLQADRFQTTMELRLRLIERTPGGVQSTVYDQKRQVVRGPTPMRTAAGAPVMEIPFVIATPSGLGVYMVKPPVEDIVTLNMSHYRTSADLEWGRHIVGLPTPVVSGASADNTKLQIGGTAAWILPDPTAKAYFLEFTGQGLLSLENAMKEKQSQLASMSARLLDQSSRGSEAAEAVRMRYLSETASLAEVVRSAQKALVTSLNNIQILLNTTGDVQLVLPTDFLAARLSAADITSLMNAYFRGGISKESLVYNLRRGDLLDPARTDAQEMGAIKPPVDPTALPATNPTT